MDVYAEESIEMRIIKEKPPSARLRGFSTCQKSMKGNLQVSKYIIFILIDNVYSFLHINSYKQSSIKTNCHRMEVGDSKHLQKVYPPPSSAVLLCPGFIKPLVSNEGLCRISLWARCGMSERLPACLFACY